MAYIASGRNKGKLCVIVDVIDQRRVSDKLIFIRISIKLCLRTLLGILAELEDFLRGRESFSTPLILDLAPYEDTFSEDIGEMELFLYIFAWFDHKYHLVVPYHIYHLYPCPLFFHFLDSTHDPWLTFLLRPPTFISHNCHLSFHFLFDIL